MAELKTLTQKQKNFFKYIALGLTPNDAARKAKYKQPRNSAAANVRNYTQAFREAFALGGLTIGDIVEDVVKGTSANRVVSAVKSSKEAEADSTDFIDVPDWNARHKFIDSAIKLQDFYPSQKHELAGKDGGPVEVKFT